MTIRLSEYKEGLLREVGHFVDTYLAEQIRAVFVAGDNAAEKYDREFTAHAVTLAKVDEVTRQRDQALVDARFACIERDHAIAELSAAESRLRAAPNGTVQS